MRILIICLILSLNSLTVGKGQNIKVQPYLQDASPNSVFILWETDASDESIVEWGLSESLGSFATGTAQTSSGAAQIHEVKLEGLERFTTYYYRVQGAAQSEIFSFKTPPFASDEESFRIVAMSDMQRDGSFPNKYEEIINEGVLDYLSAEFGGDVIDNLALVMIPGDLVVNGNAYGSWESTFFTPAQNLLSRVPVYPVPGNHENNAAYFFQYFKLPDNGSPGFEEHWWYKDYGNTRIIGLDSNSPFSNQEQLDWLADILEETCEADSTDFVFAQLHHPHKSELWTPGESNYTGEVINLLEQFSTNCGKPSIHFFGHTHGYSRGQSRDHKHLWINAATAGGAIDNWGEFPNFDYDEFTVSQDEYGFVLVEITDGTDPQMHIKRIGRGDQDAVEDNILRDTLTVKLNPAFVDTPEAVFPKEEEVAPECVVLQASAFSGSASAVHGQSHWQVFTEEDEPGEPVFESWKNFENWYFEEDTQAEDDLTDEVMTDAQGNTDYWWRVRYRDRGLNWSEWTDLTPFSTGESLSSPNLLINPGAEDGLAAWGIVEGVVEALEAEVCNGISPASGDKYFAVGGLCEHSPVAVCIQEVDVSIYADSIDTGSYAANFGGHLSNFGGSDLPEMRLIFLTFNGTELGTSSTLSTLNSSWTLLSKWENIPAQTRTIRVELKGTRNAGTDNDSYFDDLFLRVGTADFDCTEMTSASRKPLRNIPNLELIPNPLQGEGYIKLSESPTASLKLYVVNTQGIKVNCEVSYDAGQINLRRGNLKEGTYFFFVRDRHKLVGKGKFVVL